MKIFFKLTLLLYPLLQTACTKGSGPEDDNQGRTEEVFTKSVLLLEFVSFDCVYCPAVTNTMNEAAEQYPGRIDVISVHGHLNEDDPMEFEGYRQFQNYFYGVTGYPAVIIDQHDDLVSVGSFDMADPDFLGRLNTKSEIGIALNTKIKDRTVTIETILQNKGVANDDYRLVVAVLENGIKYKQADWVNNARTWIEDYTHHHVLRDILTDNYFGDPVTNFRSGNEYRKTFSYIIPEAYKKENISLVAYVVEARGFAERVSVNSRSVSIGKSIDFSGNIR